MSDREEWTHARAEIDRLYSLLEAKTASAEAAQRDAYEKLRGAAQSLVALYDTRSEFDHLGEIGEKIEQLREAMK